MLDDYTYLRHRVAHFKPTCTRERARTRVTPEESVEEGHERSARRSRRGGLSLFAVSPSAALFQ